MSFKRTSQCYIFNILALLLNYALYSERNEKHDRSHSRKNLRIQVFIFFVIHCLETEHKYCSGFQPLIVEVFVKHVEYYTHI